MQTSSASMPAVVRVQPRRPSNSVELALRRGTAGLRVLGLILILLFSVGGIMFGISSHNSRFQYLAILTSIVAGITLLLFLARLLTDPYSCLLALCPGAACCSNHSATCCNTGDAAETPQRAATEEPDMQMLRTLRWTKLRILTLLYKLGQLGTSSDEEQDQELVQQLRWYLKTEHMVLTSWLDGGSVCTERDVHRMYYRLSFMCSQGPLSTGPSSHDLSYQQWLSVATRWINTLRLSVDNLSASVSSELSSARHAFNAGVINDAFIHDACAGAACPLTEVDPHTPGVLMEPPPYEEQDPLSTVSGSQLTCSRSSASLGPVFPSPSTTSSLGVVTTDAPPPYVELSAADLPYVVPVGGASQYPYSGVFMVDAPPPYQEYPTQQLDQNEQGLSHVDSTLVHPLPLAQNAEAECHGAAEEDMFEVMVASQIIRDDDILTTHGHVTADDDQTPVEYSLADAEQEELSAMTQNEEHTTSSCDAAIEQDMVPTTSYSDHGDHNIPPCGVVTDDVTVTVTTDATVTRHGDVTVTQQEEESVTLGLIPVHQDDIAVTESGDASVTTEQSVTGRGEAAITQNEGSVTTLQPVTRADLPASCHEQSQQLEVSTGASNVDTNGDRVGEVPNIGCPQINISMEQAVGNQLNYET